MYLVTEEEEQDLYVITHACEEDRVFELPVWTRLTTSRKRGGKQ
jgi:hypothetical protein